MKFIHFVSVSVCDPGIFMLMIFLFEGLFGLLAIGNFFFLSIPIIFKKHHLGWCYNCKVFFLT